jgi:Protein of unknown function (DUF1566)/Collagen triple helix repeat (20 copies)
MTFEKWRYGMKRFILIGLSILLSFMLLSVDAWAVDDATIQEIQNDATTAKNKSNSNDGKITGLYDNVENLQNQIDNIQLIPGPEGPAGPQGPAGAVGPQGPQGEQGLTGPAGTAGADGLPGADGAVGPQGPIGLTGPAGADGATGPQGPIGLAGPQGPAGAVGPQGPQGEQGLTGPAGTAGADGLPGADGAVGPQGPIGLTGPAGADGATGPQGPIGLTGPQGPPGAVGPQGPQGEQGPAGADGAVGPQGPEGQCECPITAAGLQALYDEINYIAENAVLKRFVDLGDGTVRDNTTGLIWLKNANRFGPISWTNAISLVGDLEDGEYGLSDGSVAGDWRIPSIDEFISLKHPGYTYPALCDTLCTDQWREGEAFTNVQPENGDYYWVDSNCTAGGINPMWSYIGGHCALVGELHYLWAVRDQ